MVPLLVLSPPAYPNQLERIRTEAKGIEARHQIPQLEHEDASIASLKSGASKAKARLDASLASNNLKKAEESYEEYKTLLGRLMVASVLSQIAREKDSTILVRPINSHAFARMIEGASTKGMHIKAKSADWGPHKGYIPYQQKFSKLQRLRIPAAQKQARIEQYQAKAQKSIDKGAAIRTPLKREGRTAVVRAGVPQWASEVKKGDELIEVLADPKTKEPLTADIDLLAIASKAPVGEIKKDDDMGIISDLEVAFAERLNEAFKTVGYSGGKLIHHGPEIRNPGAEEIDYPIAVYEPSGAIIVIQAGKKDRDSELRKYFEAKKKEGFELEPNPRWNWTAIRNPAGWTEARNATRITTARPRPESCDLGVNDHSTSAN